MPLLFRQPGEGVAKAADLDHILLYRAEPRSTLPFDERRYRGPRLRLSYRVDMEILHDRK